MGNLFWIIITIVIISTVVGAVARLLNSMNELNNAPRNRAPARPEGGGGVVRQSSSDMDRFLAEIDRLRKKHADASTTPRGEEIPVAPVVQPARQSDRPRTRVVAEIAEPASCQPDTGFGPPALSAQTTGPKAGDLPLATVVSPLTGTGVPTTRVTKLSGRARPSAKTPFAKNLTSILNSGQGLALAVVLQEILGPPRSKQDRRI